MLLFATCELHFSSSMRCYLRIIASVTYYLLHLWIKAHQTFKVSISDALQGNKAYVDSWLLLHLLLMDKHRGMSRICFLPNISLHGLCLYLLPLGWGRRARKPGTALKPEHLCVKESISAAVITYLVRSKGLNNLHRNVCIFHDFKSKYIFDLIRYLWFLHF